MEPIINIPTEAITRAGQGDAEAQAWLYRQYSKAMFNICIRMTGNRPDAEDMLQNAFILAFKNLRQLKQPAGFGGWLRRIVINECIRHIKGAASWTDLEEHHSDSIAAEEMAWWTTIPLEKVHEEIKLLPEGCRQVFVLYALEDYPHKDIAGQLGISESTSKSQYHRARKLLKERITQIMITHG